MKEKIISEIIKREMEKFESSNKREDQIEVLEETPMGTDVEKISELIAKREGNEIKFYNKTWTYDMRGYGGPAERDVKYKLIDITTFNIEMLNKLLEKVKSSKEIS